MEKLTLTVKEMAAAVGVSEPTAYQLTEQEGFPCLRVGRKKLIPIDGLRNWMAAQAGSPAPVSAGRAAL